jgi:protein tyrosine phosphatase
MKPFRKVELETPGSLFLHSMPGKDETLATCFEALEEAKVQGIICLNPMDEIQKKSPDYAEAINAETLPCEWLHFPIGNGGVPNDKTAFLTLARQIADRLRNSENFLIHCKGGVGRTGTFASCVTAALGQPLSRVTDAGGKAETDQQKQLIAKLQTH